MNPIDPRFYFLSKKSVVQVSYVNPRPQNQFLREIPATTDLKRDSYTRAP